MAAGSAVAVRPELAVTTQVEAGGGQFLLVLRTI